MKASIVIVHFSNVDYTADCVQSVLRMKTSYEYEILIIDNANKRDDVAELKRRLGDRPDISFHTNTSGNTGFSRGIQLGLENARNDYLVILDNDTLVEDRWLDGLLECFAADPRTGIATAQIFSPDLATEAILGGKLNVLGFSYSNVIERDDRSQGDEQTLFYGITAWAIKKSILEKVTIDTHFQFFSDDADIGYKVKSLGYVVAPAMRARVMHLKTGKDKALKREALSFKTKICNRDYWAFSYLHLAPAHFAVFSAALVFFKLAFLPARLVRGDGTMPDDAAGFVAFLSMLGDLRVRRRERAELRTVSYWSLFKQYSWKLYVGPMIFK